MEKLRNKKAQQAIGSGLAALGFIVVLGILLYYFFLYSGGQARQLSSETFYESKQAIITSNYLNNVFSMKDEYGYTYSELLERAIDSSEWLHPSNSNAREYFAFNIKEKICKLFEKRFGADSYRFSIIVEDTERYVCYTEPSEQNPIVSYNERQYLPLKDGKRAEIILETWEY